MAVGAARQQHAVLQEGAAVHGVAGVDVFRHGMLHEPFRGNYRYLATAHVRFIDDPTDATEVVDVGMGNDHRHHRALAEFVVDKVQCRLGGFLGGQGVEDDPARIALDERDVGQVKTAHLVNLVGHDLVQPIGHVQHGLALQGWVDAVVVLVLQQIVVAAHVPGNVTGLGHDLFVGRGGDEAFLGFFEVALVFERQRLAHTVLQFDGVGGGRFTLGIEVLALHRSGIGACLPGVGGKNCRAEASDEADCQGHFDGLVVHAAVPSQKDDLEQRSMRGDVLHTRLTLWRKE
ncbi:hypothetical protein D3C80_1133650 [compost metagenome]